MVCLHQTFPAFLRHASFDQTHLVDIVRIIRIRIQLWHRHDLERDLSGVFGRHRIHRIGRMYALHAFDTANGFHILFGEANGGDQLDILHVVCIKICICRIFHIRHAGLHAGKEGNAQRYDEQDGQKASQTFFDLPQDILQQCTAHQYSILSTGRGCSLRSMLSMRPLRTLMTLSPIAVKARLCVMTMTQTPLSRQVSCNSLRICLPV